MRKTKNKDFACSSEKSCQNCGNCLYICEGDFFCEAEGEVVLTEWNEPTDKYMACGGRKWEPSA